MSVYTCLVNLGTYYLQNQTNSIEKRLKEEYTQTNMKIVGQSKENVFTGIIMGGNLTFKLLFIARNLTK